MIIFTAPGIAKQYSGKHFAAKNPARKEKSFKKYISYQILFVMGHSLHPGEIIVLTLFLFMQMITAYLTSNSVSCFSGK